MCVLRTLVSGQFSGQGKRLEFNLKRQVGNRDPLPKEAEHVPAQDGQTLPPAEVRAGQAIHTTARGGNGL